MGFAKNHIQINESRYIAHELAFYEILNTEDGGPDTLSIPDLPCSRTVGSPERAEMGRSRKAIRREKRVKTCLSEETHKILRRTCVPEKKRERKHPYLWNRLCPWSRGYQMPNEQPTIWNLFENCRSRISHAALWGLIIRPLTATVCICRARPVQAWKAPVHVGTHSIVSKISRIISNGVQPGIFLRGLNQMEVNRIKQIMLYQ